MNCPHCSAKYEVVRVEAATPAKYPDVTCLSCGGALPAHDGAFLMKYFLVQHPSQRRRRTP
jgi:hypothetical protein